MTPIRPPLSYYEATARPSAAQPPLAGTVDCDVCVVGGGIAGCSTALHLAESGYRVVLLEQQRVGWGASGRSGGQILPGYACGQEKLKRLVGGDAARAMWDVSVEGVALVRGLIERHGIDCDWVSGHLQAAVKPRHREELLAEIESLEREYGYTSLRQIDRPELEGLLATRRYLGGLYDADAGHLHPLNYTLGLAEAARRLGVQIYESTRATRFIRMEHIEVRTQSTLAFAPAPADFRPQSAHPLFRSLPSPDFHRHTQGEGTVRCRHLVFCGNTSLGEIAPPLAQKIVSVGTYVVATERLGEARARELIANNMAVSDLNWIIDYFRCSADHRLLFGGRVSYSGLESGGTAGRTRKRMLNVFPQLAGTQIEYSWGGYIDITVNRAPHFGRLAPEVYFLQGFSGHGIALAGMAGKLVAQAVAGTAERFDLFNRIRHRDFPGGPGLRRPLLVLAMLYYRLRDLL